MSTGRKKITFLQPTTFYIAEDKDWLLYRKANWTSVTADRFRFIDRVKKLESILLPQMKQVKNG